MTHTERGGEREKKRNVSQEAKDRSWRRRIGACVAHIKRPTIVSKETYYRRRIGACVAHIIHATPPLINLSSCYGACVAHIIHTERE